MCSALPLVAFCSVVAVLLFWFECARSKQTISGEKELSPRVQCLFPVYSSFIFLYLHTISLRCFSVPPPTPPSVHVVRLISKHLAYVMQNNSSDNSKSKQNARLNAHIDRQRYTYMCALKRATNICCAVPCVKAACKPHAGNVIRCVRSSRYWTRTNPVVVKDSHHEQAFVSWLLFAWLLVARRNYFLSSALKWNGPIISYIALPSVLLPTAAAAASRDIWKLHCTTATTTISAWPSNWVV